MSTSVIQCNDCGAWNWEGTKACVACGSSNLTMGFHEYYNFVMQEVKLMGKKEQGQYKIVRKQGGSRVIAIGNYIPQDWNVVKLTVNKPAKDGKLELILEKAA